MSETNYSYSGGHPAPATAMIPVSGIGWLPGCDPGTVSPSVYGQYSGPLRTRRTLEPLRVRRDGKGGFQLVDGYVRMAAYLEHGTAAVPAQVYDMTEEQALDWRRNRDMPFPGRPAPLTPQEPQTPKSPAAAPPARSIPHTAPVQPPARSSPAAAQVQPSAEYAVYRMKPGFDRNSPVAALSNFSRKGMATGSLIYDRPRGGETGTLMPGRDERAALAEIRARLRLEPGDVIALYRPDGGESAYFVTGQGRFREVGEAAAAEETLTETEPETVREEEQPSAPPEQKSDDEEARPEEKETAEPEEGNTREPVTATEPDAEEPHPAFSALPDAAKLLRPPESEAERTSWPRPRRGEEQLVKVHPAWLKVSGLNYYPVDTEDGTYAELRKSIESDGRIHDPVSARVGPDGGLEILSGQRRFLIAEEMGIPVPVHVMDMDDDEALLEVGNGNLTRKKIPTWVRARDVKTKYQVMMKHAGKNVKLLEADILADEGTGGGKDGEHDEPRTDKGRASVAEVCAVTGMGRNKLFKYLKIANAEREACDWFDEGRITLEVLYHLAFISGANQKTAIAELKNGILDDSSVVKKDALRRLREGETAAGGRELDAETVRGLLMGTKLPEELKERPMPESRGGDIPAAGNEPEGRENKEYVTPKLTLRGEEFYKAYPEARTYTPEAVEKLIYNERRFNRRIVEAYPYPERAPEVLAAIREIDPDRVPDMLAAVREIDPDIDRAIHRIRKLAADSARMRQQKAKQTGGPER